MTADANFEGDSISARQTANDNCRRLAFGWEGVASSTPTRGSFATLAAELSRLRQQTARKGNGNDTRCVPHQTDARRRKAKPLWRRRKKPRRRAWPDQARPTKPVSRRRVGRKRRALGERNRTRKRTAQNTTGRNIQHTQSSPSPTDA